MKLDFIEEKTFDKANFKEDPLKKGEYELCVFRNCEFSNADLSDIVFIECEFTFSNLSLAKLNHVIFRAAKFKGCKLLGLQFNDCNEFGFSVEFDNCVLDHSSFYGTHLNNTRFRESKLHEVDFTLCDLKGSVFDKCDLTGTIFDNTNIEKADFRTSFNYSISPETNRLKKAKFSLEGLKGLLDKYDIEIYD